MREGAITIDDNDIQTPNINRLTYKRFSVLTGNSTNDLLMDYKSLFMRTENLSLRDASPWTALIPLPRLTTLHIRNHLPSKRE